MKKCIGCILPSKNVIEGKIEEKIELKEKRGNRPKQQLDDLREMRGYCKLKRKH
jgi:hypothetical protein